MTDCGSSVLKAALDTASRGWPVFPCVPSGKRPLTTHGFKDATIDESQIRAWWEKWPDANLAVPTGSATVDVLDIDVRPDGDGRAAFERMRRAGLLNGATKIVRTPSGGLHVWFPGSEQLCSSVRGHHVDFKASGGYVLVPPSHVITDSYAGTYIELDRRDAGSPLNWTAVRRLLDPNPVSSVSRCARASSGGLEHLAEWLRDRRLGERNSALYWAARTALSEGHSDLESLAAAAEQTGLPRFEVERTIRSARRVIARDE